MDRLSELEKYGVCHVEKVLPCPAKERLEALGVCPGAELVKLFTAPCGDPAAYLVKGAAVAIRRDDAARIIIKRSAEWEGK